MLTAGQASDKTAKPELLSGLPAADVVADRRYDSDAVRALVRARGAQAHIPSTSRYHRGDGYAGAPWRSTASAVLWSS